MQMVGNNSCHSRGPSRASSRCETVVAGLATLGHGEKRRQANDAMVASLHVCRSARPREADQLLEATSSDDVMIPHGNTLQRLRVKLDMLVMIQRRWEIHKGHLDEAFFNLAKGLRSPSSGTGM